MNSNTEHKTKPVVLICPLDWGLGHASRCIPVIQLLLKKDCNVYVAGSDNIISYLEKELNEKVNFILLGGKKIRYGRKTFLKLLLQTPGFIYSSLQEHYKLKKLIRYTGAHAVISDNRYGLWSKNVVTVFMTHQVNIKLPGKISFLENVLKFVVRQIIKKHNMLWVVDLPGKLKFAGDLSSVSVRSFPPGFYTGLLTRFSGINSDTKEHNRIGERNYVLCIISGPEPQRTIFEEKLLSQLQNVSHDSVVLRGTPGNENIERYGRCIVYNHTDIEHFSSLIAGARLIICRSGYSTLMDIAAFGGKALLVPTPGQPEQEYLAGLFKSRGWCYCVEQDKLDLEKDIQIVLNYQGIPSFNDGNNSLDEAAEALLEKIVK